MAQRKGFQVIQEVDGPNREKTEQPGPAQNPEALMGALEARVREATQAQNSAAQAIGLALRALSARALSGLGAAFTLGGLVSAWFLWRAVLPNPTPEQLIGLGLYGALFLALETIRRRKP